MAFLKQIPAGSVDNANAYIDPAILRAYALDRGVDLTATVDAPLQVAIVKATDFMDSAYAFIGVPLLPDQGTAWPRGGVPIRLLGLPKALLDACCKLALRAAQNVPLQVDPSVDPSGLVVASTTKKVGPIESTTAYFEPTGGAASAAPDALAKRFPDVELGLRQAGLIQSRLGGTVSRA